MKAKVLRTFKDKQEGVIRKKDDVFSLSKERFEEINSTKHGELIATVEELKQVSFEGMTKAELIEHARSKKIELKAKLSKAEIIAILSR